jgi:DNA-binding transcriptional ArsR family regulator/hypoxanthine-guanine phosphoribosyltransferase
MKTSQKILDYIAKNGQASGRELVEYLDDITPRAIRKQLKTLLEAGQLRKIGRPPKVFYLLAQQKKTPTSKKDAPPVIIADATRHAIDTRYLFITPDGEIKQGWDGFVAWCEKTRQEPVKTSREYIATLKKYDAFVKNGLIDGMRKIRSTFHTVFLGRLFYVDFYSIERFGKTKIGQILLHAKNSQDKKLIKMLTEEIRPKVVALVQKYSIDGVLFIPPTVRREVQFMKELEKNLKLPVRTLVVTKVKTQIAVAQKTLSKLEDRIENAKRTIIVEDTGAYKNILIIDDAVGSGSTLNETAAQVRKKKLCTGKIIGLAIVGSFKGFDVISEV